MKNIGSMAVLILAMVSIGALNAEELRNTQKPVDRLTWTDSSGKYWWKELHESFLQNVATNPTKKFDFVMIGDSITRNWAATSGTGYFTQQTCNLGKAVADQRFAGYRWLNLGIGGDGTSQVIWRIQNGDDLGNELEGFETGLISLMVGTNNRSDSAEDVALGIKTIIETIRARQPKAKILVNAILPRFPRDDDPGYADNPQAMNVKNKATNDLIKEYCDGTNVIWFDWTAQLYKNGELDSTLYYDREHPAEGGYTIWANNLLPYIKAAAGSGSLPGGRLFHLKNGITDWTAGASYTEEVAPGEGDVIVVPDNATVYLNASTDSASLALVNKMRNVYLTGDESRVEINVAENDDKTISISISAYGYSGQTIPGSRDYTGGPIVKTGLGTLRLTSTSFTASSTETRDYYSTISVAAGTLYIQQNMPSPLLKPYLGRLSVSEGATVYLPSATAGNESISLYGLSGAGTVNNTLVGSYKQDLTFKAGKSRGDNARFTGRFTGTYNALYFAGDDQEMAGDNSDATVGAVHASAGGVLRATTFGKKNQNSALGYGVSQMWVAEGGGTIEYTGEPGYVTERGIAFNSTYKTDNRYAAVLDGGTKGGITFGTLLQRMYSSTGGKNLILTGSNTTACVIATQVNDNTDGASDNGRGHTMYISKEGTGTWKFNEYLRDKFASGISVDEGVLQYATISNQGFACSIGTATNLTNGAYGKVDTNKENRVEYAIRLGAATLDGSYKTSGRFEYVGTTPAATDRKIALAGAGGLRQNLGGNIYHFGGVKGISANAMTLYLDGDSTDENQLSGVSDGDADGKVSVVKEGEGTWALAGELTFSGDLEVRGGELIYRKQTHYQWYRWTITALFDKTAKKPYSTWKDGNGDNTFRFYEFGLYDKDGYNQTKYFGCDSDAKQLSPDFMNVRRGFAQLQTYGGSYAEIKSQSFTVEGVSTEIPLTIDKAFDETCVKYGSFYDVRYQLKNASGTDIRPSADDPNSAVSVLIKLKADAHEVVGYDYINTYGGYSGSWTSSISNYYVEASLDGVTWDRLDTVESAPVHHDGGMWTYQGGYTDGEETHTVRKPYSFTYTEPHVHDGTGWRAIAGHPATLPKVNAPTSVKVTGGGKLTCEGDVGGITISKLKADATSGGTIDGFAFAANGTLDITNCPQQGGVIPLTFANATGVANLANWSLTINGKTPKARNIKVTTDGKLEVQNTGLVLTLE